MRNLKPILEQFGEYVVSQSRLNLTKGGYKNKGQNASGSLSKSLAFEVMPNGKNWVVEFIMQYYGQFVDKGVSGTKERRNTPYRFRSKGGKQGLKGMPPPDAFAGWAKLKGIKGRDKKTGRFITDKKLQFLIARSVFEKGIKPSLFFTTPFNKAFEDLNQTILDDFNVQITKTFKKLENGKN